MGVAGGRQLGTVRIVDPGRARAFGPGRLAAVLLGFGALAFGVGAAVEAVGLGRELVIVAAVVLALAYVLVLLRGATPPEHDPAPDRVSAPLRPGVQAVGGSYAPAPAAAAGPDGPALRAERALLAGRTLLGDRARGRSVPAGRSRASYLLGVTGGAALALTLGGVLVLAMPGDRTALALLLLGVVAGTTVILLTVRLRSGR